MKKIYLFTILILSVVIVNGQAPPVANFGTGSSLPICEGTCISFTDNSTNNPTIWNWTFPGGSPSFSTLQNPNTCYNTAGNYNVKLVVANSSGADSLTKSNYVAVNPNPPIPVITCSGDTICSSYDPGYTSYQWSGSGGIIPGLTNRCFVVSQADIYTITVSNEFGCTTTASGTCFVGLTDADNKSRVDIYPNPVDHQITIHTSSFYNNEVVTVSILNMLGQETSPPAPLQRRGETATIDVSDLTSGIYFLQLKGESGSVVKKFVKK